MHTSIAPDTHRELIDDLNAASLELDRAHAVLDLIYTLACHDDVESLCKGTLASALDEAMNLTSMAKDLVDGKRHTHGEAGQ